eukprot:TRINITY_DN11219_c0_g1_i1.p2 TRINITY_DN11219_c0_g1~~TRINITY_DN11219_c0_g1_i1.p2  ORF type:complete len:196 (+),score=11.84 TRINITY_DN11219_c0_g1_i1:58-645(+)
MGGCVEESEADRLLRSQLIETGVPDESGPPVTRRVWIAPCPPRETSRVLAKLARLLPLHPSGLDHLKRVKKEAGELLILVGPVGAVSEEGQRSARELGLGELREASVPAAFPASDIGWKSASAIWPMGRPCLPPSATAPAQLPVADIQRFRAGCEAAARKGTHTLQTTHTYTQLRRWKQLGPFRALCCGGCTKKI